MFLVTAALALLLGGQESFPAFALQNWDGRAITNASFEGKTTIVVPTYAKCVFACPMITLFLTELDKELGASEDVQYLHISVNPHDDTAEEIRSHWDKHAIDAEADPRWLFANASEESIDGLLEALDVDVTRTQIEEGVLTEHSVRVYVVGPHGEILARFDTYFWERKEMLHALRYGTQP